MQAVDVYRLSSARLASHKERMALRVEESGKLSKFCEDYVKYSPHLDGTVFEILEVVRKLFEKDEEFIKEQLQGREEDHAALRAKLEEFETTLKERDESHTGAQWDAAFAQLLALKQKLNKRIEDEH